MSLFLNLIVFTLCGIWFHQRMNSDKKKLILPVVGVYLLATIFVFIISLVLFGEYLDGLLHLISAALSLLLFWLWTTIVVIIKNVKNATQKYILGDLAQNILLLIVPLLLWLWIKDVSFKIGG